LLAVSIQNIVQNPQNASPFYLALIYQQLNGTHAPIPLGLPDPTVKFIPPTSGVWVNGLWFLSLVVSLTCALLSTLLQQWARRYLRVAYPRYKPHKRARIRAFYKHGVEKLRIPWAVELLPALLHISLFLFFAGLSVFLFSIQHTIFKVVTAWIALCGFLYVCLTCLPIVYKDSPYSAPLSSSVSFCLTGITYVVSRLYQWFSQIDSPVCFRLRNRNNLPLDFSSHSMTKAAEKFAFKLDPDIDYNSLLWTFESLDEDTDLEKFFEGLPRLCDSETGRDLKLNEDFIIPHKKRLSNALIGLMTRTMSSNLVNDSVKQRRVIICTKAADSTSLLGPWWVLYRVLFRDWQYFLRCIEFGLVVQNWTSISDKATSFSAHCVVALTISFSRYRDERWIQLASGVLDASKSLLHKYSVHGDNIRLASVIFIVRRTIQTYSASEDHRKDILNASSKTLELLLELVCKLDIRRTLPELQYEFCGLWNRLVLMAQDEQRPHYVSVSTMKTLKNIRKLYITLHECSSVPPTAFYATTDDGDPVLENPMSYHMCEIDPCSPFLDLQPYEPAPDAASAPSTPNIVLMPSPTIPGPSTLPILSHYSAPLVDAHPHPPAPPLVDATVSFPEPQLGRSYASNVSRGCNVQSPTPPPPGSSSLTSLIHSDNVSTQHLDPLGGHG
jgi:hypothetical protein